MLVNHVTAMNSFQLVLVLLKLVNVNVKESMLDDTVTNVLKVTAHTQVVTVVNVI